MSLNLDKSTWTRVAFGDVIDSITDRVDDPSQAGVDRYVGLEHLDPGVMTVQRWGTPDQVEAQKLRFQPGDVIFGRRRAYQKKVAMAEFEGICSAHALVLRAKPGRMSARFLPVFLSSDYFLDRAISISVGSLSPTVNWRDLSAQEFALPPLDEQERLANLLWAVEQEANASWHVVQQLTHLSDVHGEKWVVDCEEMALSEVLEVAQYGSSSRLGAQGKVPVLRMTNLANGQVGASDLKYADLSEAELASLRLVRGDILFNRTNSFELVGHSGLFDLDGCFAFASYLVRLRTRSEAMLPEFLNWFINSPLGQSRIRVHVSRGVSQANVSPTKLKTVMVPVPTLTQQHQFVQNLAQFADKIESAWCRTARARELKSTVLADIFGGAS